MELELPNLCITHMVPQAEPELWFDSVPKGVDSARLEQGQGSPANHLLATVNSGMQLKRYCILFRQDK